ncbi:hypothetical protein [Fluviicola taffensis]|uniref:hypothetical protein n=1 Tax=Fluviicola taffensis TaxID=191579 RepID=UPI0031383C28
MLRNIFILIAVSLLNSANSFAQTKSTSEPGKTKNLNTGFYGKRFMLQLGGGIHHNTLLKITSSAEKNLRNTAYYSRYKDQIKPDQFNYSLYGNLGVVLKERFALSLDFNYYMGNTFLTNIGRKETYDQMGNYIYSPGYDSRVKYTTLRIMPRIEIGSKGSNMPVGLVNVLGLGIELSKLKSGTYKSISAYDSYSYYTDSTQISNQQLKFEDEFAFNLTLMYGLEYRLAISKNIAWNFGGYVHLNIPIQELISDIGFYDLYGNPNYNDEYRLQLSRYRAQNLFSVRTGLVIML